MRYSFPMIMPISIEKIWQRIARWYYKCSTKFLAWLWGVKHGKRLFFLGKTIIRTRHSGEIVLGDNVMFNSQRNTNLVGLLGPTVLDTRGGGRIEIGNCSGFSSVVMSSRTLIKIGNNVKVGGNVRIFDHDFHAIDSDVRRTLEEGKYIRSCPVIIDDDCFIGTNAIILKGTHLGPRTIVAAGAVVFGLNVPADSMVKGNPAQIIGLRVSNYGDKK